MQIDQIDIFYVSMPLKYPWRTSYGTDYFIHSILVKGYSGDHIAWAESTPLEKPTYSPEAANSVFLNIVEYFAPLMVGKTYETIEQFNDQLNVFKGNQFAKAALEILWWTLQSKITGIPLHIMLGGVTDNVEAGADFGIQDDYDMLLGNIQKAVDDGFSRVKLKVSKGWDVEMLETVRSAFPNIRIHIDCNSGYSLGDVDLFEKFDEFNLEFIEQPLGYDDLLDHSKLSAIIKTPVCLDESINSIRRMEQAIEMGACEYVNIKPGRVGGLYNSVKIHDMCFKSGIPVWVGGMLESAVGSAICVELATLPNFSYPGDLFPSDRFYERDLGYPKIELTKNMTVSPFTDGLPEPDINLLSEFTIKKATVRKD
ncbi:MAG: o-succinylbenzoate synthase [Dehalococcoidia bacterium]|jgi:O-succinylbenzoate synthase|nr:o-succinylbenzoate synthase [Chloroflexota bacterium]MDP6425560.1 o-succinylbenzoate synthase [Dehalococcoidia bacterium]MDP7231948.1 o-succinylbenzoate synthase [Dehalococcoidia bacterium]MDP7613608.1 o-succinylbenzoate synthase [Dehalococcoidia bacterium]